MTPFLAASALEVTATAIAALSGLLTCISAYVASIRLKKQMAQATDAAYGAAVESDDISKVGEYLFDTIGGFTVSQYAEDAKVQKKVDRYLRKIDDFLDPAGGLPMERTQDSAPQTTEAFSSLHLPTELTSARSAVLDGESWNGLARLRRLIELRIREFALKSDIPMGPRQSAGRMIRILEEKNALPEGAAHHLGFAVKIANKGIHGLEVEPAVALEAIQHGGYGLELIAGSGTTSKK